MVDNTDSIPLWLWQVIAWPKIVWLSEKKILFSRHRYCWLAPFFPLLVLLTRTSKNSINTLPFSKKNYFDFFFSYQKPSYFKSDDGIHQLHLKSMTREQCFVKYEITDPTALMHNQNDSFIYHSMCSLIIKSHLEQVQMQRTNGIDWSEWASY